MPTFALISLDQVKGRIKFYKLEIDGICEFDQFCEALENKNGQTILHTIFAIMESVANLNYLAKTKFRELKGRKKSDKVKDYEVKKGEYRVYLFKDEHGNIIVFGSCKNDQKEDIARLRRIKEKYLNMKIS